LKRLNLIIPMVTLVLMLSAVSCGAKVTPAPNVDATVAAEVAATRTASDVQEKVAATLSAPTPTTAPPTPTTDSASTIQEFNKAIPIDPDDSDAYNNRGNAYYDLGQWRRAIEDYDKAIHLDPDDAMAYYNRGVAYYNLGQWHRAMEDYDKAIQLDPGYALAYYSRGNAYHDLGQYQLAIEDFDKAIQLDPGNALP